MTISSENKTSILDKIKLSKEEDGPIATTGNTLADALVKAKEKEAAQESELSGLAALAKKAKVETKEETKVSELAKELKMKTADLIEKAKAFDIEISSNRAKLTAEQVNSIRENIS